MNDAPELAASWLDRTRTELLAATLPKNAFAPTSLVPDAARELLAAVSLTLRAGTLELVRGQARMSEDLVRAHEQTTLAGWLNSVEERVRRDAPPDTRPLLMALLAHAKRECDGANADPGADTVDSFLVEGAPHVELAHRYLDALRTEGRRRAGELVIDAVRSGTPLRELYLHVFGPVQREVGRLWQRRELTIAEEHYCTAATQLVMSQLYGFLFDSQTDAANHHGRLVATSVQGDLHELGIRMIADFFEMHGWQTLYLGANTPSEAVAEAVVTHRASLVAVSSTLVSHVEAVRRLVIDVRRASPERVPVLVGGKPFEMAPGLIAYVGGDGTARSPEEAVQIGTALAAEARARGEARAEDEARGRGQGGR